MGVVICTYPDELDPRALLSRLESILLPSTLRITDGDVYEEKLAKVAAMLEKAGHDKELVPAWSSLKRDATSFGPMFQFSIDFKGQPLARGTVGRKTASVICDDPIPADLLNRIAEFARTISGATILARDADGKPVPFVAHLSS